MEVSKCETHTLLHFADDNLDGCKLSINTQGNLYIYDPSENAIIEDLKTTLSLYIEYIRDSLILKKLLYEGPELGLVLKV